MATPDESAIKTQEAILTAKDAYLRSLRNLGAAVDQNVPAEQMAQKLTDVVSAATNCFNAVEQSIVQSELLGANQSQFWARDLANTALNFLEGIPKYWDVVRQYAEKCNLDSASFAPSINAYSAMENAVLIYNPDQAKVIRDRFEQLGLPIRGFTHPSKMNTRYNSFEKIAIGVIPCLFLLIMLAIGIWAREITPLGIFIFRVVLALSAGAFGAVFIPGLFEIRGEVGKWSVRAAGAATFFAVVYLVNPPSVVGTLNQSPAGQAQKS